MYDWLGVLRDIMVLRSIAILALIGILWLVGIIDLETLPWHSKEFQICGSTVLLFLIWSTSESKYRRNSANLPYTVFYAVLLVSVIDSFLLELTTFGPPWILRWTGLVLFAAGSFLRIPLLPMIQ